MAGIMKVHDLLTVFHRLKTAKNTYFNPRVVGSAFRPCQKNLQIFEGEIRRVSIEKLVSYSEGNDF
jgi:hypothetical protein